MDDDFNNIKAAGISLKESIVLCRYGRIFRGNKVIIKRKYLYNIIYSLSICYIVIFSSRPQKIFFLTQFCFFVDPILNEFKSDDIFFDILSFKKCPFIAILKQIIF